MSFLRHDNILGSLGKGKRMGIVTVQQWWNGIGLAVLVAQLVPVGIRVPWPMDRSITRKMDRRRSGADYRNHHLCRLDNSFAMNRK